MLKFKSIEEELPKEGEYYLVQCPEFSDSGFEIAEWIDGEWEHGHFSQSCNDYVISYHPIPLKEM